MNKQVLFLSTIICILHLSCSKQSVNASGENLPVKDARMDPPPDGGMSGANLCYHNYLETLKNKPDGYLPGDAENGLTSCLEPYTVGGSLPGTKKFPLPSPAPTDRTLIPPYLDVQDAVFKQFWNYPGEETLESMKSKVVFYNSIIVAAFAENGGRPVKKIDRINVVVYYILNNHSTYPSVDIEHLTSYIEMLCSYENFTMTNAFIVSFQFTFPQINNMYTAGLASVVVN